MAELKVTPILSFKGQCADAIALYEKAFGAVVIEKIHYSQADPKDIQFKNGEENLIFYSEIAIGNDILLLGDSTCDPTLDQPQTRVSFVVNFDTAAELHTAYAILAQNATILEPLTATTYCTGVVSLQDQFNISWQLMSGYAG